MPNTEYEKLPDFIKELFNEQELSGTNKIYENLDVINLPDKIYDKISEEVYNKSEYYKVINSNGFDGPSEDTILTMIRSFNGKNTIKIYGKLRFCISGNDNTTKLLNELSSYKNGIFSITNAYESDPLTDDIWIICEYQLIYKI